MNYMICIPSPSMVNHDNCEKIHNIMARISETYKVKIVPESVKMKSVQQRNFIRNSEFIRKSRTVMETERRIFFRRKRR